MPRHKRRRMVAGLPCSAQFVPETGSTEESVVMTVEEYEAVRLMDYQGLTQEEAAASMEVGRTTLQQIYVDARRKLATALAEGRPLRIEGGEYCLREEPRGCGACHRRGHGGA